MPKKTPTITFEHNGEAVTVTEKQMASAVEDVKQRHTRIITKIKIRSKDASMIGYARANANGEDENCELHFFGAIHPDFQDALDAFLGIVIDAVGLDEAAWQEGRITGVSLKHDSPTLVGLTITAQRTIEGEGMVAVVNTPYLNPDHLSGEQNRIQTLLREAEACMDGKRAQMKLDLEGAGGL